MPDRTNLQVNIPIHSDELNEADEEFFIVYLEVEDSGTINKDLIRIEQGIGRGVIVDNRQTGRYFYNHTQTCY